MVHPNAKHLISNRDQYVKDIQFKQARKLFRDIM